MNESWIVILCLISICFAFAAIALLLGAGRSTWSLTERTLAASIGFLLAGIACAGLTKQTDMSPMVVGLTALFFFLSGGLFVWSLVLRRHQRK